MAESDPTFIPQEMPVGTPFSEILYKLIEQHRNAGMTLPELVGDLSSALHDLTQEQIDEM